MSSLPRWVEYGAFALAWVAGIINAVGLMGVEQQAISHLSGTATLLGSSIVGGGGNSLHLAGVLLSFVIGASISGYFLSGTKLKLGRVYDFLLVLEGIMLLAAVYLLEMSLEHGIFLASAACGLQNALATTYSGSVVRTTHVTGIFTDLGLMLGAKLKGQDFDRRRALLFLLIILGFLSGGSLGALLFVRYEFLTLLLPALVCFLLAAAYRVYASKTVEQ